MIGFSHQGIDPVRYVVKSGRPCMSLTLAKDKREEGKYGDTPELPLWRNQLSERYQHKIGETVQYKFSVMLNDEYGLVGYSTFMELHSNYQMVSLFNLQTVDDEIIVKHRREIIRRDMIVPGEWVDFVIDLVFTKWDNGSYKVMRNNEVIIDETGANAVDENELMYFKLGAYVWTAANQPVADAWPVDFRRLYFQL